MANYNPMFIPNLTVKTKLLRDLLKKKKKWKVVME